MNKSKKNTKIKKNNKTKKITRNGVILITIDGVRRKEIYDKKIAPYLNKIKNKSYVKNINNMKVANKYKISYPGYNDMLTGIVNKNIKTNKSINNYNKTIFEKYNLKPTMVCGWKKFKNIYNINRSKLKILNFRNNTKKYRKLLKNKSIKCYTKTKVKNNNIISSDCELFKIFIYNWKNNNEKIKCGHIAFSESDERGHENNFNNYINSIKYYDKVINYIWNKLYPETVIVTTDHGRGNKNWNNHYNNIKGSDKIWSIIISKNKNKMNTIKNKINLKYPLSIDNYKLLEHFII